MRVKELRSQLQGLPSDHLVVLAADEEGNGFRKLAHVSGENNRFEDGEIHLDHLTEGLRAAGYTEEDLGEGEFAVVLWP